MKPIHFPPPIADEMVRAILDGRKSVTRRVVKHGNMTPLSFCRPKLYTMVEKLNGQSFWGAGFYRDTDVFFVDGKQHIDAVYFRAPYRPGSILYVKEKWAVSENLWTGMDTVIYRANYTADGAAHIKWRPSIHMPKEAARLFLRVTEVRVERLQDIKVEDIARAGIFNACGGDDFMQGTAYSFFENAWDNTVKKTDLPRYSWAANPWVWVIWFERISKEEAQKGGEGNG